MMPGMSDPTVARRIRPPDPDPVEERLAERVVESAVVHRGRYLEVRVETTERTDGSRHRRDVVRHPGAVAVVALDEADRLLLVRQWRQPAGRSLLEIPAGTLDRDPATGAVEDPELASRRELEEETGYRAASWEKLGTFWTAPGFASELMHLYLATDLVAAGHGRLTPDADEALELVRLPLADALAAAELGDVHDAKTLIGILLLGRRQRG
jgi:ADP-ribose pyrophosphatase